MMESRVNVLVDGLVLWDAVAPFVILLEEGINNLVEDTCHPTWMECGGEGGRSLYGDLAGSCWRQHVVKKTLSWGICNAFPIKEQQQQVWWVGTETIRNNQHDHESAFWW